MSKGKEKRFAAAPEPFESASATVKIGPDERLLIPAALRRAAGLTPGEAGVFELVEGELHLATYPVRFRNVQEMVCSFDTGEGAVVDELIRERRQEAARE